MTMTSMAATMVFVPQDTCTSHGCLAVLGLLHGGVELGRAFTEPWLWPFNPRLEVVRKSSGAPRLKPTTDLAVLSLEFSNLGEKRRLGLSAWRHWSRERGCVLARYGGASGGMGATSTSGTRTSARSNGAGGGGGHGGSYGSGSEEPIGYEGLGP